MKGDSIVIEAHHHLAAEAVDRWLAENGRPGDQRLVITVAGESGSGKSETAAALAEALGQRGIHSVIFQQDDYFILPPRRNDQARREDIGWVGPGEVRLDLLDEHLAAFKQGAETVHKPLVDYGDDEVGSETLPLAGCQVAIAEGTYTSLLENVDVRVFIDRDWQATRAHRERRRRDASELDPFIDRVLTIEHEIISAHRQRADLVIDNDYNVRSA
ncbi:MAG: zeta toxin family protein [Wenzhouxiangella sp.]